MKDDTKVVLSTVAGLVGAVAFSAHVLLVLFNFGAVMYALGWFWTLSPKPWWWWAALTWVLADVAFGAFRLGKPAARRLGLE